MAKTVRDIDHGYRAAMGKINALKGVELTVGYHKGVMHDAGEGKPQIPTAAIAAAMEFGSRKRRRPPRPTLGPTADKVARKRIKQIRKRTVEYLAGRRTLVGALGIPGEEMSNDVKKAITALKSPPLKQSTILARARKNAPLADLRKKRGKGLHTGKVRKAGGTNPLVDTTAMRGDVNWQVKRKFRLF